MKTKTLEQALAPAVKTVGRILTRMGEPSLALAVGNYKVTIEHLPVDPAYIPAGRDGDLSLPLGRPVFPKPQT